MGIQVEYSHHEVAHSQHEIDLRYADALTMADIVMTYRIVVKEIAKQYNVYATFMPKPVFGQNGSGIGKASSLCSAAARMLFLIQKTHTFFPMSPKNILPDFSPI